jgi:Lar family restriction alleviation protein
MNETNPAPPPSIELLPCPFCGGEADPTQHFAPEVKAPFWIDCNGCEAALAYPTKEEAYKAWNTRQRESAIRAEAIAEFVLLLGTEFEKRAMFFCYRDAKESLQAVADEMMETKR